MACSPGGASPCHVPGGDWCGSVSSAAGTGSAVVGRGLGVSGSWVGRGSGCGSRSSCSSGAGRLRLGQRRCHAALSREGHQGARISKVRKAAMGHHGHRVAKAWKTVQGRGRGEGCVICSDSCRFGPALPGVPDMVPAAMLCRSECIMS